MSGPDRATGAIDSSRVFIQADRKRVAVFGRVPEWELTTGLSDCGSTRMLGQCSSRQRPSRVATTVGVVSLVALTTLRAGPVDPAPRAAPGRQSAAAARDVSAAEPAAANLGQTSLWQRGSPVAIAVHQGRAEFDVPAVPGGPPTLLIVSALARGPGPFPVRLEARSTAAARPPAVLRPRRHHVVRLKPTALPLPAETHTAPRDAERTFHVMARDGDVASASNYLAVQGRLRAVGKRVQVYVDHDDLTRVGEDVLRDLVATFDSRVYPTAATTFGSARDVDGDGRFTVLMSHWLTRLGGGRHAVDGYVRAADFDTTLAAPFGNHCDMMYLSTALEAGPHLRTILAHEYTHAVTLCAKKLSGVEAGPAGWSGLAPAPHREEEGWLDEALAHLVEDLHGFSRSNIDYRVSAFLSQPVRYRLVVEDYYAADLFRSHGNRGGTYLFLRWCADRFGPALVPALVRSGRRGTDNLEAATGVSFTELYRQWTVALYLSGLEPHVDGHPDASMEGVGCWVGDYRSLPIRGRLERCELAGPRPVETSAGGEPVCWSATGTSTQYVVVAAPADPGANAVAIRVSAPPEADLQVTAVPLPPDLATLQLAIEAGATPDGNLLLHAWVREARGVGVTLTALAWEPLVPAANPRTFPRRSGALDPDGIARAFGTATLAPGGTLTARPIQLGPPPSGDIPLIVKLVGTDAAGRRVAAWAEVPPMPGDDDDPERSPDPGG
jgi:hypothetical protein